MKPSSFRLTCAFIAVLPAFVFAGEEHSATYDIRVDTSEATRALLENYRAANANHARRAADLHATMARGQAALAARVPQVRVDANPLTHLPEIVASEASALTGPSGAKHEAVMRKFVTDNAAFFGLSAKQAAQLKTNADYANPAGNLSWVELEQIIHGIPVFQGTIRAALGKDGAIARTTGNLAAGLDEASLPTTPKLTPAAAAAAAAGTINVEVDAKSLRVQTVKNDGRTKILSKGPFTQEIQTDLVYFPLEPGVATLAYSLVLWQPVKAYYMIVDAQTGTPADPVLVDRATGRLLCSPDFRIAAGPAARPSTRRRLATPGREDLS